MELSEEEASLVGLDGIKKNMSSVMDSLKWEYANVVTSRLNPCEPSHMHGYNKPVHFVCVLVVMVCGKAFY